MAAVKRILRYFNGTCDLGPLYRKDEMNECIGYSVADWAEDLDDRKSTSAYIFHMGGAALSWRSKRQACVALSTAEAEYMALASAAQARGRDSHMKQTGMLVGNFEFNP